MNKEQVDIKHARNGGEKKIGHYSVDGYDEENKTIYEFDGCLWHGCRRCYVRRDTLVPGSKNTVQDVYDNTLQRECYLRSIGYKMIIKWECDFRKEINESDELKMFTDQFTNIEPLNPRLEAYYGGRTNATQLLREVEVDDKIR